MKGNLRITLGVVLFALGLFCLCVLNKTEALGYFGGALCITGVLIGTNGWDARVESLRKEKGEA